MSFEFSANEIFEMAEQLERNGAKFYRTSAEGVKDPASRDLLQSLADMEDTHEKTFASMRASLSDEATVTADARRIASICTQDPAALTTCYGGS